MNKNISLNSDIICTQSYVPLDSKKISSRIEIDFIEKHAQMVLA